MRVTTIILCGLSIGMGLIKVEEGLDIDLQNPELIMELVDTAPVPEPASILLIGFSLAGLALFHRKNKTRMASGDIIHPGLSLRRNCLTTQGFQLPL